MALSSLVKKFLLVPAAVLGVALLIIAVKLKPGPQKAELTEHPRAVRVVEVREISVTPRAVGYGYVQPAQVWKALSEVSGRIVAMHPELDRGSILKKGELLFRIDPEAYDLAQARSEADVRSLKAQLKELDQNEQNLKRSLAVELRSLALSQQELERMRQLYASRSISKSQLDTTEQSVLAQRTRAQNLRNTLNLIPSQRASLKARIAAGEAQAADTRLNLSRTTIVTPFDCRISAVNVELEQFTPAGQVLAQADDISVAEILAHFPIRAFYPLLPRMPEGSSLLDEFSMENIRRLMKISALVRLELAPGLELSWTARFVRLSEGFDPQTRTVGVYVSVKDPYRQARLGLRPPLVKNMYVEVELKGSPKAGSIIIPRSVLRQGRVYVADEENRLRRRSVTVDYAQGNFFTISQGLKPGDRVVVSDLSPAIEGMLLSVRSDEELLKKLTLEAAGEGPVK